jgi:hypothetical protein
VAVSYIVALSFIMAVSFIGGGNQEYPEKTTDLPQVNDKRKSNYHTITTTADPEFLWTLKYIYIYIKSLLF